MNEELANSLLAEFAKIADQWYTGRPFVKEFQDFFQRFFESGDLAHAEWADFQQLSDRIHSFNSLAVAKRNAFGRPNYPIETYRRSFEYLARGADPLEVRMRAFLGDKQAHASKYLGEGAVSEIVGQLFANDYVFMNSRDLESAAYLGIERPRKGDFPSRFMEFNRSLEPLKERFEALVGYRGSIPKGLQIDQFLSWIYETKLSTGDGLSGSAVNRRVWVYAAGERGRLWDDFRRLGAAGIGWDELGDLRSYSDRQAIQKRMIEIWPNDGKVPTNNSLCVWQFCNEVKVGDLIISRRGRSQVLGVGVVVAGYSYAPERSEYKHLLGVDWHHYGEWDLPKGSLFPTKTLTDMTPYQGFTNEVLNLVAYSDDPEPEIEGAEPEPTIPVVKMFSIEAALEDLYLSEQEFRRWLDLWNEDRNLVLQGPPGTGKTFVARRLAYCLIGEEAPDQVRMVQFHPSYGYEDFVQGWKPSGSGFARKNGSFFAFCEKARKEPHRKFVFIIDEFNRGNLAKIFGELLVLLESDKRGEPHAIQLAYQDEGESFHVPRNLYVLGMMNTADRSIAVVDYALRRRFRFVDVEPAFEHVAFRDSFLEDCEEGLGEHVVKRMLDLNRLISEDINLGPGYRIGHSYFCKVRNRREFEDVVRSQIRPLLREMWFDSLNKAEDAARRLLEM